MALWWTLQSDWIRRFDKLRLSIREVSQWIPLAYFMNREPKYFKAPLVTL